MRPYLIILYFIACIFLGATSDALFDDGMKLWAHGLGALEVGLLLSGAFIFKLNIKHAAPFLISYIAFRIVGYDFTYNLLRGLPINYLGNTSIWDRFFSKYPIQGLWFARAIFLTLGISLTTRYLK